MIKKLTLTALLFMAALSPIQGQQTPILAQIVANMQPGTFAVLSQDGDGSGYGRNLLCMLPGSDDPDGIGCSFGFSRKAAYDPVSDRVLHIGAPHSGTTHYIQYDVSQNKWSLLTGHPSTGHTHSTVTLNPLTREFFASAGDTGQLQNLDTGQWRTVTNPPRTEAFGSYEFFPERDELLHIGGKTLSKWNRATDTWTVIADESVLGAMEYTFNEARYSSFHKAVLLVGGYDYATFGTPDGFSHALFKYDINGTITRLPDSPPPINTGSNTGLVIADPASGEFLFLNSVLTPTGGYTGEFSFWSFNPMTEVWTDRSASFPKGFSAAEGNVFASLPVAVPKYGVTLWMSASIVSGVSKVLVYKHGDSPTVPPPPQDTIAPTTPTGLTAVPASTSQINLAWSASTDNVAVTGYKVYQDGVPVAMTQVTSYSVLALTAGATYSFAVQAVDAAGNSSPLSIAVTATTPTSGGGGGSLTFAQKCVQDGVLGCWAFDDESELRYGWDANSAALNAALAGKINHSMSFQRGPGEGNVFAIEHVSGALSIPAIDKTVGENGSLRMTIPSQSEPNSGWFQDNFNKRLELPSMYITPGSPWGDEIYMQYRIRVNDVMLNTVFRTPDRTYSYWLETPAAGSTTVRTIVSEFTPAMVGRAIALQGPYAQSPWVKGIYTIKSVDSPTSITVDRSPTPTAAGTLGLGVVGGLDTADYRAGGWKTDIIFGNSPNVGSSGAASVVTMNPRVGIPIMYGQQGLDGYGWQDVRGCTWSILDPGLTFDQAKYSEPPCKRFKVNDWIEITKYVKVGGQGTPDSHVKLWVDGELAVDYPNAKVYYGSEGYADGLGQFDLLLYHTNKDPTQEHGTGLVWYDNVITSTKPIPMGGGSTPQEPPPPVNQAPVVVTLPDVTVTLPETATLTTTVSDDGLPVGSTLTGQWTATGVTFGSPNALTTTASAAAGSYNVTYTASDGDLSTSRTMNLTVKPAPGDITPPVVTFKTLNNTSFNGNSKVIELTVSDNVGVVLCEPTVNGIKIQPAPIWTEGAKLPATVKFYLQQATIPKGTYTLGATCKDAAGNQGAAVSINVIRK